MDAVLLFEQVHISYEKQFFEKLAYSVLPASKVITRRVVIFSVSMILIKKLCVS
jgi:hypothetical protein